jgi:DNA-binding LytR/AlgR family response regulator
MEDQRDSDRKRILIIDDNQGLRSSLTAFLAAGGFEVESSEDGDGGLAAVRNWKPDLVILDLRMPGKAGWDVMKEIRENPSTADLPVILLTAVKDQEAKVLGFRSGADDYLEKPFHALELMARIDRIFQARERLLPAALEVSAMEKVPVRTGAKVSFVPRKDIFYIEAAGKYSYVHTRGERYLSDCSLKEIEEAMLCQEEFFRVHRSYLVNLDRVVGVTKEAPGRYIVELDDDHGTSIYVSQRRLRDFKERLHLHF